MTFLEKLQSHRDGLIKLKTELYWYGGRGYDGSPDRICLILDAADADSAEVPWKAPSTPGAKATMPAALLLIDGSPQWVWVAEADVEILDESR